MKKSVSTGLIGLVALGVTGDFIISLPLSSDDGSDILGMLIAIVFSFAAILAVYQPLCRLFALDPKSLPITGRASLAVLYILALAFLLGMTVCTLMEFAEYASAIVLQQVHKGVIFAVATITAALIAGKGMIALSKCAAILMIVSAVLVVAIFLFSIPKMSLKYIIPNGLPDIGSAFHTALAVYFRSFASIMLPISVIGASVKGIRSVIFGNAVGAGFVMLCVLNTLLVFGGGFASKLPYPYTSAVSTVSLGDIFSRMDGFLYVTVFFTCIMKLAVTLYGIKTVGKKLEHLKKFLLI